MTRYLPPYIDVNTEPSALSVAIHNRLQAEVRAIDVENDGIRALAQAAYDLALAGGGGGTPTVANIFNTAGVTTLRGVDVVGFEDAANDIDARLTALGY